MREDESTSNRMVRIASRLHVWEADLALARLAAEGLRGYLGNASFVLWFWQYSNAAGGVTLHVAESDARRAHKIVFPVDDRGTLSQPAWTCPACRQRVDPSWLICWNCSTSPDGERPRAEDQHEEATGSIDGPRRMGQTDLLRLAAVAVSVLMLGTGDLLAAMAVWAILVVLLAWRGRGSGEDAERVEPDDVDHEPLRHSDPAEESIQRRCRMGEAIALRAWQVSVIGLLSFPPLLLYSPWLLWRLDTSKTPVGRRGNNRRYAAGVVSAIGILLFGWILSIPFLGSFYFETLPSFFDLTREAPRW